MDAAERDPALSQLHTDLTNRRREPLLTVLQRGRDRGELPPDSDPELTTDLLTSPFFYRHFVAHRHIPRSMITDVIARVLQQR
ncbi:TetR-like C-terminal domain-containing protein [Kribbella sp. NPDC048915]|uniref:TetR-like C-terminal domain-containing protein n=1 Tax=Kribbella sp. NPDC048915 TaxID=3155148 RepID=UPI0033DB0C9A